MTLVDESLVDMMTTIMELQKVGAMLADAGPEISHGQDSTGTVSLDLARTGELDGVEIAYDWKRRLGDRSLGGAVMEAIIDANNERARSASESRSSFEPPEVSREEVLLALENADPGFGNLAGDALPVDVVELAERFLALGDTVDDSPDMGESPDSNDPVVVVRVSGAIKQVIIDQRWAVSQTSYAIADAIMEASKKQGATPINDPLMEIFVSALSAFGQTN